VPNVIFAVLLCWIEPSSLQHTGDLSEVLQPLIDSHHGKVAVAVRHLETRESFGFRCDVPMPTASLIKLAVMIETYQQSAEGVVDLDDRITLAESDKMPGSGILNSHFSPGTVISLRDAVRLMIVFSDNTATNLVLDKIGLRSTADRMEAWGFPNTKIHAKVFRRETSVFPERSQQFGLGSTTAGEMIGILQELHDGSRIRAEDRTAMLDHLKRCDDKEKFTRFLPANSVVAHKTGSLDRTRTDAGILYTPRGPVAVCVLTTDNEDVTWRADNGGNLFCARVARACFDYFGGQ